MTLIYNKFKEHEKKKKFEFKIIQDLKFTSKTKSNQLLSSISFNNKFWKSHLYHYIR